ncbi:SMODS domain-containing nucleotidyltransferase [Laspinema olomoucense]|uniref:SMODS domain-containing nucleotidyltransferase n=1 Tax=Laspinema olomoucense TaxID=3231600 RepID=UPI0021BB45B0|nr:nucleotidyltransferase domain-containing protein [Laspinema sp. D3d]MCT7971227.1 hypothetical protein [Laspinema sp. D3d]
MNVAAKFQTLCNNLTIETGTRSRISERYQEITYKLNKNFWASSSSQNHSYYVGSYGRNTAIRGFSDLDILFVLPTTLYNQYNQYSVNGQSALLQVIKNSILEKYSRTDIGGDGQVVIVNFSDGIRFEIVPAFKNLDGSFKYPDSNKGGRWRITNPMPEIKCIKDNNKLTNDNLINLCRMARAWRNKWDVPMGGLLIDTLANSFLMNWEFKKNSYLYYDWMTRDFLNYLSLQDPQQQHWRAVGSGQYIYRKGQFEAKAKKCHYLALQAIEYQLRKRIFSETLAWREIYGTAYPE